MPDDHLKPLHLTACDTEMPLIGGPVPPGLGHYMELRLNDHVPTVVPTTYGLPADWPAFDPHPYFRTSGEALAKARYLYREYKERAHQVDSLVTANPTEGALGYQRLAWGCVLSAGDLLALLTEVRGDAVFLEVTWHLDHMLTVRRTNPRDKPGE